MTYWTDPIAIGFFYASFIFGLAMVSRAVWRALWRRDDRRRQVQQTRLDSAVEAENRTADTVDLTERYAAAATLREESIPIPGMVMFRGGLVHKRCLAPWLRDDARPCAGCAVHLDYLGIGTP